MNSFFNIKFSAPQDLGAGVVVLMNGKIYGGDSSFQYVGTYSVLEDNKVSGTITIARHSNVLPSVIPGLDHYQLNIIGTLTDTKIDLDAHVVGEESLTLKVSGNKIIDI